MYLYRVMVFLIMVSAAASASNLKDSYDHFASLDENGNYFMYWTIDQAQKIINISVAVKTTGWVGLGISPYTGRMPGSDVIIGWVESNGTVYLQDRYATGHSLPSLDTQQDYTLLSGKEINGTTILKFFRKFNTNDGRDLPIEAGTTRLIWSYHSSDPSSPNTITKHQKQGSRSVNLLNAVPQKEKPQLPNDTQYFDIITHNVSVPAVDTTYWCSAFKLPQINGTAHIIKMAPVIQKGHEGLLHHILIYDCIFEDKFHGVNHNCESRNMPQGLSGCRGATLMSAWAIGGEDVSLPAHVGLPLGGTIGTRYVLMETHYDNPQLKSGILDSSGMRFYYTFQKRKYDAGILEIGRSVNRFTVIPEKQAKWDTVAYCSQDCTKRNLPSTGINIIAGILHTHLAGTAVTVRQFRNDKELPLLANNPHYDFNYQEYMYLRQETKVMPGDQLSVICRYNTEKRTKVTTGGLSSLEEMCLSFMLYYPKQELAVCLSYEPYASYISFFNALRTAKQTPPYNDYPSKPPYIWSVLNETTIGGGKFLKQLVDLENSAIPMQYCAARNHKLLQASVPMPISKFVRVKANVELVGGAHGISYSIHLLLSMLLSVAVLISEL